MVKLFKVDQAILSEEDRVVLIRFGHDWDPTCMMMDETLFSLAEKVSYFFLVYLGYIILVDVPIFLFSEFWRYIQLFITNKSINFLLGQFSKW